LDGAPDVDALVEQFDVDGLGCHLRDGIAVAVVRLLRCLGG
jgi:hypothetical protein